MTTPDYGDVESLQEQLSVCRDMLTAEQEYTATLRATLRTLNAENYNLHATLASAQTRAIYAERDLEKLYAAIDEFLVSANVVTERTPPIIVKDPIALVTGAEMR